MTRRMYSLGMMLGIGVIFTPAPALTQTLAAPATTAVTERSLTPYTHCYIDNYSGPVQCAHLTVPIDWGTPSGDSIALKVMRLPSLSLTPLDPVLLLAGGPGQAGAKLGGLIRPAFAKLLRTREIIVIDQRGTGGSHPLPCDINEPLALDPDAYQAAMVPQVKACADSLDIDPEFFGSLSAVHDIDALRAALGREKINLWGGSYGTRLALLYAAEFPDHARSLILDSVTPPSLPIHLTKAQSQDRAFQLLLSDCAASPRCKTAYGDLGTAYDTLLTSIGTDGLQVSLPHPTTGEMTEITITRELISGAVFSGLYRPERRQHLPAILKKASLGEFAPLLAFSLWLNGGSADDLQFGLMLSVFCAEDVPHATADAVRAASENTISGAGDYPLWRAMCSVWPVTPKPYHDPENAPPTLLLSGNLDPVTPPSSAAHVAAKIDVFRHIIVPHSGHITSMIGCVPDLIGEFLETLDPAALDPACLDSITPLPFVILPEGEAP